MYYLSVCLEILKKTTKHMSERLVTLPIMQKLTILSSVIYQVNFHSEPKILPNLIHIF
jgi:hypothetical protein